MADNGSSNTAIVAIVILVLIALGAVYIFFGKERSTTVIENPIKTPTKIIERTTK